MSDLDAKREAIRDALKPVMPVVVALLDLGGGDPASRDYAAVVSRVLFAVVMMASHDPDGIRELDRLLSELHHHG